MRRGHNDVSAGVRHDAGGERHRCRGNTGRIAAGLLTDNPADILIQCPMLKARLERRQF
jgi:hypothetical protein